MTFTLRPDQITEKNYHNWVKQYEATDVQPPPEIYKTKSIDFSGGGADENTNYNHSSQVQVDEGYKAIHGTVASVWNIWDESYSLDLALGSHTHRINKDTSWVWSTALTAERDSIPFALNTFNVSDVAVAVEVKLQRTERAMLKWRLETHAKLTLAYKARLSEYEEKLATLEVQAGVATGRCERDSAADLRGALPPVKSKRFASITDPKAIGKLLRDLDGYQGSFVTICALKLAPLVFVRPGELRHAEWLEVDLDEAMWRIPGEKMKMKQVHLVPLSRQVVEILRELYPLTGGGKYLFPGVRSKDRPMSENTVLAALRRLGYTKDEMTGHGFRSMASTILNEKGWDRDAIERQLAHAERDAVRAAYNYAEYLPERKKMMQEWADYLDKLKAGAEIIPINQGV